jgi:Restriction endonuclease NotI
VAGFPLDYIPQSVTTKMPSKLHPLAEVFGFPVENQSPKAVNARKNNLCPYNNGVPNCTKDKAKNPLGVCSIHHGVTAAITCPVRFREDWIITSDAASFFFGDGISWSSLTEVRLTDADGKSAGNIDVVLVAYDANEKIIDFGALEVQAVYISGNIRAPFEHFMEAPSKRFAMDWSSQPNYPRPDYLSSSRKRLAPQLMFKGGIMNQWGKKSAVAMSRAFFDTLPPLDRVSKDSASVGWFIYDLILNEAAQKYELTKVDEVFTQFSEALLKITTTRAGSIGKFVDHLQGKLDECLTSAPTNKVIESPM